MSIPRFEKEVKVISGLPDLPNANDGLTAEELKAKFDEAAVMLRDYINDTLLPALLAENLPFAKVAGIEAENVQKAIETVHGQIRDAATGTIVDGSVTREKLAEDVLNRAYGGRVWVSMEAPTEVSNVDTGFPVGQQWLRPGFTVVNGASDVWSGNGCTVKNGVVTGDQTAATATASQALTGLGNAGDRVRILFDVTDRNGEVSAITVSVNGAETAVTGQNAVEATLLAGGALSVVFTTTWTSAALAEAGWTLKNYTVVNVDQVVRQVGSAKEVADWIGFLRELGDFDRREFPAMAWMQTNSGQWWPMVSQAAADGYLKSEAGQPVWKSMPETVADIGALRCVTGTYMGTGGKREITLPVEPKLLMISPDKGPDISYGNVTDNYMMLRNGGMVQSYRTTSDNKYRTMTVKLTGVLLTFTVENGAEMPMMNTAGLYYTWVAVY